MSQHREAFEQFRDKAEAELGDSLKKMVLYGSVARGDEREDSDIDIFVLVESEEEIEKLRDLAYDIGVLEYGVSINVQGKTAKMFEGFESTSYLRNISREGVEYA